MKTKYDLLAIADPKTFMQEQAAYSWENAKGFFAAFQAKKTDPPETSLSHPNGGMQALLDYRSSLTEELLGKFKNAAQKHAGEKRKEFVEAVAQRRGWRESAAWVDWEPFFTSAKAPGGDAPGSKDPTSDIDVNTFNDGTEFYVAAFNKAFAEKYAGFEAGIVFDVNVYGKDFLPKFGDDFSISKATPNDRKRPFVLPIRDHEFLNREIEFKDARAQMAAGLLKLRRHLADRTFGEVAATEDPSLDDAKQGAKDWREFHAALNRILESEKLGDPAKQLIPNFKQLEKEFHANLDLLAATINHLAQGGQDASFRLNGEVHALKIPKLNPKRPADANALMSAENRIYEAELGKVEKRRIEFDALKYQEKVFGQKAVDESYRMLRSSISDALFFANEAYVTAGAVTQVVGGKQKKSRGVELADREANDAEASANIAYGAHELVHSIIDNLADIYKETKRYYHHHEVGSEKFADEERYGGAVLKSSKYFHRLFNAIKHLYLIFGIVEAYEKDNSVSRKEIWKYAMNRFPGSDAVGRDFADVSHFLVFRKLGFGLESLKKLTVDWSEDASKKRLRELLEKKFSLKGEKESIEGQSASITEDFAKPLEEVMRKARGASTARIAASAVVKFFSSCLVGAEYKDIKWKTMSGVRSALTLLVVHVLADYCRFCEKKDPSVGAAMKAAGRPYPRLNETKPDGG